MDQPDTMRHSDCLSLPRAIQPDHARRRIMRIMRALLVTALATSLGAAAAQAQGTRPATTPPKRDTTHAAQSSTMNPAAPAPATAAAPTSGTVATPGKHWNKNQIEEAQKGLAKTGFYTGPVNGTWTHATASAMRAYQRANKMTVTGQLTDEELVKLKAS
jgi:peptidoglycan hydrolase-like protein with peptidoglycan-binding domain